MDERTVRYNKARANYYRRAEKTFRASARFCKKNNDPAGELKYMKLAEDMRINAEHHEKGLV